MIRITKGEEHLKRWSSPGFSFVGNRKERFDRSMNKPYLRLRGHCPRPQSSGFIPVRTPVFLLKLAS